MGGVRVGIGVGVGNPYMGPNYFSNTQINKMMNMGLCGGHKIQSLSYSFVVRFKDSSKKEIESKIYIDTALKKTYLLVVDKNFPKSDPQHRNIKIFPEQTISIARAGTLDNDVDTTTILNGAPTDSCWRFKTVWGHISAYSYLSELDNNGYFTPAAIIAIQLNDGPVIKFSEESLIKLVGKDRRALGQIKRKQYYEAILEYNDDINKGVFDD